MQSPYTDYDKEVGIEKPAVQLVGFAKTGELEEGESETVEITVDKENLKVYDTSANDGEGTYIVEEGDYYFTVATDAHEAVNNILAKKDEDKFADLGDVALTVKNKVDKSDDYAESEQTGNDIKNQFVDADMTTYDEDFTYLTRSDWEGTYPKHYELTLTDELNASLAIPEGTDDDKAEMPETDVDNGLTLAMMREVDYDDPLWDTFLDQLSAEEMYNLVRIGGYQTQAISSVGVPATVHVDGPAYVGVAGPTGVTTVVTTLSVMVNGRKKKTNNL